MSITTTATSPTTNVTATITPVGVTQAPLAAGVAFGQVNAIITDALGNTATATGNGVDPIVVSVAGLQAGIASVTWQAVDTNGNQLSVVDASITLAAAATPATFPQAASLSVVLA